tara:strand:+ start:57 stop:518 length:462 start_codon:yes stop_codon:yes gene_type:complete
VVPVKGGPVDLEAFQLACQLTLESKAKLYALYVIEVPMELPVDAEIVEETAKAEDILGKIEGLAKEKKCPVHAEVIQARRAGPAIVQEALERDANLVVLGTTYKYNNGSHAIENTSFYVLSHAACPVLLWREFSPVYIADQRNTSHAYPSNGS